MGFGMGSSSQSSSSEPWADLQPFLSGFGDSGSSSSYTGGYDQSGAYIGAEGMYDGSGQYVGADNGTATTGSSTGEDWSGLYQTALDWYQGYDPSYYSGQTVASVTPATQSGWDMMAQRATEGSPVTDSAQSNVTDTLSGDYLYSNPSQGYYNDIATNATNNNPAYGLLMNTAQGDYLNSNPYITEAYDSAAKDITDTYLDTTFPTIQSMYEQYGRSGSGLESEAVQNSYDTLSSDLSNLASEMYYQNYTDERQNQLDAASTMGNLYGTDTANQLTAAGGLSSAYQNERGNQMTAAGLSTDLANQDYTDIQHLLDTGTSQQDYAQSLIDSLMTEWEYNQNSPLNALSSLAQLFGSTGATQSNSNGSSFDISFK